MAAIRLPDPRIAPEVRHYLRSRRIALPDCPPKILTPDPGQAKDAVFDASRVDRVLDVFSRLRHTQGRWAGRPLRPDPWQVAYVLAPVFGWIRRNEQGEWVRVVRRLYVEVPRRNGKTTLAGGLATYLMAADGEPGAQVYAVASTKDQARFCFDPVKAIAEHSPDLSPNVRVTQSRISHTASGSYFGVVASLGDTLHGANIHGAIIDELHVHRTPDLVHAVESGTGSRRQPLVVSITTADDGRQNSIYAQRRERIEQLARGAFDDVSTYGVVWAATEQDDPFAEATWRLANPGFGISPSRQYLLDAATEAKQSPADLAKFLRLNLGLRTKQETKYIELPEWDAGLIVGAEDGLAGQVCYGGLDLASTSDLCALAWVFPELGTAGGGVTAIWRLWAPEAGLEALNKRTAGAARVWVREGWLLLTPGNVTDYQVVRQQINADRAKFRVKEIAFDPWNSSQLVNDLVGDGAAMVPVRQGFASMSPPTKELKRLLMAGLDGRPQFRHFGNPCVRWQVDNLGVEMDAAGNVKPSRANSSDKIDALVAAAMGLDRAMRHEAPKPFVFLGAI